MKFLKYVFIPLAILSVNTAASQDTGHGYTIISEEDYYNVPMPDWMKQAGSTRAMQSSSGTVIATAYPTLGHPSPSVTSVLGSISASLYNTTASNQYYTLDEFICIVNLTCNERKITIGIAPSGSAQHSDSLKLNIQLAKGYYQNVTSCNLTGAQNIKAMSYAGVSAN